MPNFGFLTLTFVAFFVSFVFGAEDCSLWPNETAPIFPTTMTPQFCDGIDTGSTWGDYERNMTLYSHNYYRAQLAHGCSQMPNNTFAPPGRDIRKMIYNCSLEIASKAWGDKCLWGQHSPPAGQHGLGENMCLTTGRSDTPDRTTYTFFAGPQMWWQELILYGGITSTNTTPKVFAQTGHWGQMAWNTISSVGCSVSKCPNGTNWMYIGVCQYWRTGGNNIYDIGNHCQKNDDCTVALWRTCDIELGLCTPSPPENEPTFPCNGENTGVQFQDNMRKFAENKINELRSELANGKTVKSDGTFAPKAVNMPKVIYNCTLEKIAQNRSRSCPPYNNFPNSNGETVFQELNRDRDEFPEKYIQLAFDKWWSEFKADKGSVNITSASTKFNSLYYGNWAQMASTKTVSIGCGYSVCMNRYDQSMHTVVCKYYQNVIYNTELYTVGNPCIQDSECTLPGYNFCDVTLGLCSSTEVLPEAPITTTTTLKPETTTTVKVPEATTILPTEETTEINNNGNSTTTSQPTNGELSTTHKPDPSTSSQASMTSTSCPESTPGTPSPCQLPEETTKPPHFNVTTTTTQLWETTVTDFPPCSEGGLWSEWSAPKCNETCGLCGFETQTRECISEQYACPCIGEAIKYGARCNDTLCKFPKTSCCSPFAKVANVGGTIKCVLV